jgi:methyl-accepting chemotaxis protein
MKLQTKHIPLGIGIFALIVYFLFDVFENKQLPENVLNKYLNMSDDELYKLDPAEIDQIIQKSKYIQKKYNETTDLLNRIKNVNDKRSKNIPQYTTSQDKNISQKDIDKSIEYWNNTIDEIINKNTPEIENSEKFDYKTYSKIIKSSINSADQILDLYKGLVEQYPSIFTKKFYNDGLNKNTVHFTKIATDYQNQSKTKISSENNPEISSESSEISSESSEISSESSEISSEISSESSEISSEISSESSEISSESSEISSEISSESSEISSESSEISSEINPESSESLELPVLGKYEKQCLTCGDIIPLNPNNRKLCNSCKQLRKEKELDQAKFINLFNDGVIELEQVFPKLEQNIL